MVMYGVFTDAQHPGDLPIGMASGHKVQYLPLTVSEEVVRLHLLSSPDPLQVVAHEELGHTGVEVAVSLMD